MLNGKDVLILLIVELIKKVLLYKMSYFPEPYTCNNNKTEVELDLSNYAKKNIGFAKKVGLSISIKVDKC